MTTQLPGPLVSSAWLASNCDDIAVVDIRWYADGRSGRQAYEAGHLPGAVWVDLDRDLAAPPAPGQGRHPLPDPERFAATLGTLGIGDETPVVAYDDAGGSVAARLWWMLQSLDHPVAVLDGGFGAWTGPVTTAPTSVAPASFTSRRWPDGYFVAADDVDRLRHDPQALVLDARAGGRYEGEASPLDPRPGHIPGARSAPWAANLDPGTGRFLPADRLRTRYGDLGAATAARVVAYCGSGVTACHDLLALRVAGFEPGALFTGSWSAWGADAARPNASGPDPRC